MKRDNKYNSLKEIEDCLDRDIEAILQSSNEDLNQAYFLSFDKRERILERVKAEVKVSFTKKYFRVWQIAAALIPILFLNVAGWYYFESKTEKVVYREIVAARGDKMIIVLPDGSKIWLNSESSIRYPEKFNKKRRNVILSGEAFFEVEKDEKRPFIVTADDVQIQVLGTSFNVSAYKEDDIITTALETGKINLHCGKKSHLLTPGQSAVYSKSNQSCHISRNSDNGAFSGWKSDILKFSNTSLNDVLKILQRKYNANLELTDSHLQKYTYTFTSNDETLEEVLSSMKEITPIDYIKISKRKYLLYDRNK